MSYGHLPVLTELILLLGVKGWARIASLNEECVSVASNSCATRAECISDPVLAHEESINVLSLSNTMVVHARVTPSTLTLLRLRFAWKTTVPLLELHQNDDDKLERDPVQCIWH